MASQILSSETIAWAHWRTAASALVLTLALSQSMGCKAARTVIAQPSYRHTEKPEPTVEPAMAANVAVKSESIEDDAAPRTTQTEKRLKRPSREIEPTETAPDDQWQEPERRIDIGDLQTQNDASSDDTARTVSSMDRLNAALNNSDLEAESLPQRSLTGLNERLRVDALLARAKKLLEVGQVDQAHEAALQAQSVGDTAQIDYSPDEDRPIDLVRQIEGQLEAIRLKLVPQFESPLVETADTSAFDGADFSDDLPLGAASPESKSPNADHDNTGLARIRRDWSTIFRQKKKEPIAEPVPAAKQIVSPETPRTIAPSSNRQARRTVEHDANDAVVLANRSVSLGQPEMDDSSLLPPSSDNIEDGLSEVTPGFEELHSFEEDATEPETRRTVPVELATDASRSTFDSDDSEEAVPEFEVIDPVPVAGQAAAFESVRSRPEIIDEDETDRESDWTVFYIGFGLCSILAFACYRRGAT